MSETHGFVIPFGDDINGIVDPSSPWPYKPEEDDSERPSLHELLGVSHDALARAIAKLPAIDQDIVDLRFTKRSRQEDIAAILELTQAAISYRLQHAFWRLRFHLAAPDITETEVREQLGIAVPEGTLRRERVIEILTGFWKFGSQTAVARATGAGQGRARHVLIRWRRPLVELAKTNARVRPIATWLDMLVTWKAWGVYSTWRWSDMQRAQTMASLRARKAARQ